LAFDRVVFDADSTLSAIEGIDELARLRGVDVAKLTERAMRGEIPLESVYRRRLERVRPSVRMVAFVAAMYVERRVRGAKQTIEALARAGAEVWVVSGALRQTLIPLTHSLGIPGHRVYAVDLFFDTHGRYAGFDEASPLARADGKRIVLEELRDERKKTALIGDGATDLAAAGAVDAFIAYTGVARREKVVKAARFHAHSYLQLRKILGIPTIR
jgi:phosphoserine phosphatase